MPLRHYRPPTMDQPEAEDEYGLDPFGGQQAIQDRLSRQGEQDLSDAGYGQGDNSPMILPAPALGQPQDPSAPKSSGMMKPPAGIGLMYQGAKTPGATGDAEMIGGGAMTGLQYGGPIGAAVGAGVGTLAAGIKNRGTTTGNIETTLGDFTGGLIAIPSWLGWFGKKK